MEAKGASIVVVPVSMRAIEQVLSGPCRDDRERLRVLRLEYFKEHPDANLRLLSGDLGTGSNSSILMAKGPGTPCATLSTSR